MKISEPSNPFFSEFSRGRGQTLASLAGRLFKLNLLLVVLCAALYVVARFDAHPSPSGAVIALALASILIDIFYLAFLVWELMLLRFQEMSIAREEMKSKTEAPPKDVTTAPPEYPSSRRVLDRWLTLLYRIISLFVDAGPRR